MISIAKLTSGLIFALGLALVTLSSAAAQTNVDVKRFSAGDSTVSLGIVNASQDVELTGPQALTTDASGNLFVLDQMNQRIVRFDPKHPTETPTLYQMPPGIQPSDLVVRKDEMLVWDGGVRTLKVSGPAESTRSVGTAAIPLEEVSTRAVEDVFAVSAFSAMGSRPPGNATEMLDPNTRAASQRQGRQPSRQYVASRGRGSVMVDVIPEKKDNGVVVEVRAMDGDEVVARFPVRVRDRLGSVEFLEIDHEDRLYVLGENIPKGSTAVTFIARYSPLGSLEGIYELPLANTPVTRRFVTVSGTGDVYFLRTEHDNVTVVGVGFRPLKNGQFIDVKPKRAPKVRTTGTAVIAAIKPSNRQQVIETAFAFEGIQWLVTPENYGPEPDTSCTGFSRIRRPWYLQGKTGQYVRGVPYCWGCHGSLIGFRNKVERGTMAGNVCTRNAPRSDVVGVDCSAFVSAAWGLSTHYTTAAMPAIAKAIDDPLDLRPGDALNKPGSHVMLFLRFTPDRKAEVMEASTGACNGRVCRNIYPLASLLARGYTPIRFKALADDTTVVAQSVYPSSATELVRFTKKKKKRQSR